MPLNLLSLTKPSQHPANGEAATEAIGHLMSNNEEEDNMDDCEDFDEIEEEEDEEEQQPRVQA